MHADALISAGLISPDRQQFPCTSEKDMPVAVQIYLFFLCGSAPGVADEYRDSFAGTLWTSSGH
jgi:hypothetical protein